jgi:hypothetical protein
MISWQYYTSSIEINYMLQLKCETGRAYKQIFHLVLGAITAVSVGLITVTAIDLGNNEAIRLLLKLYAIFGVVSMGSFILVLLVAVLKIKRIIHS